MKSNWFCMFCTHMKREKEREKRENEWVREIEREKDL